MGRTPCTSYCNGRSPKSTFGIRFLSGILGSYHQNMILWPKAALISKGTRQPHVGTHQALGSNFQENPESIIAMKNESTP